MSRAAMVLGLGTLCWTVATVPAFAHRAGPGGGGSPMMPQGGGGGPMMMDQAAPADSGFHKHFNLVLKPFFNQANGNVYTMLGVEMLGASGDGWMGGFGMYKGLNLGDQAAVDATSHGGFIFGKEWGGPLTLGISALVGMGHTVVASPQLTFSNFGVFLVGEPRISLGWVVNPNCELSLSASYLATTRPSQVAGPSVMATMSMIRYGHGH